MLIDPNQECLQPEVGAEVQTRKPDDDKPMTEKGARLTLAIGVVLFALSGIIGTSLI